MKKVYFLLATILLCSTISVFGAPYGLLINGTIKIEAAALSEKDYQERDQFLASCVELQQGDTVQLYDFSNGAAWMCAIDPYGEYQKFTKASDHLVCNAAGAYDFYIKLKYEDDMLYIGPAQNCGDTPTPNPHITSVPSACPDVMLQGFYWDSYQDGKAHGNTRWTTLQAQATEIAAYFDLVWLPPSAKSSGGVGYHPKQYNNQNSDWGKRTDLEHLIQTFHAAGTKVVADIVINHIDGKDGWCSYYEQDFGEYGSFPVDGNYICKTDEVNFDPQAGSCNGSAIGPSDDGYGGESNYGAARDLAHNSEKVREMCRAYTKWMIDVMGFDGFRYDYCKGFHTSHINDYNANAQAYFSVMEYWDGDANVLWNRIAEAGENTLTFDFGVKYQALNDGIAKGNYNGCKAPGLLGKGKGKWAVTFVDSHDSYQRDGNEFGGAGNSMKMKDKLLQANAFILSMPGIPCVFYPHWQTFRSDIAAMVLARKAVGVHSESAVSDEADAGGYRAWVTGSNGTLLLELGNKVSVSQSGFTKAASGNGWIMWTKTNSAVAPALIVSPAATTFKTETLTVEMRAVGGAGATTIYYTLDGTDPTASATRSTYSSPITLRGTTTLQAYAEAAGVASDVQTHVYTYEPPQTTPITLTFRRPDDWKKVYLYTWNDGGAIKYTGNWPGAEMTKQNAKGWYYHQFDATVKEVNFIFNNGAGIQSSDLWTDEDVCYGWENGDAVIIGCWETDIEDVPTCDTPSLDVRRPMYNVLGQRVNASYHGIVIQDGKKYLR